MACCVDDREVSTPQARLGANARSDSMPPGIQETGADVRSRRPARCASPRAASAEDGEGPEGGGAPFPLTIRERPCTERETWRDAPPAFPFPPPPFVPTHLPPSPFFPCPSFFPSPRLPPSSLPPPPPPPPSLSFFFLLLFSHFFLTAIRSYPFYFTLAVFPAPCLSHTARRSTLCPSSMRRCQASFPIVSACRPVQDHARIHARWRLCPPSPRPPTGGTAEHASTQAPASAPVRHRACRPAPARAPARTEAVVPLRRRQ